MKNPLRKLLPVYRVAGAMENQLTDLQRQMWALERQNEELRKEIRNFYWLNQCREGESLRECQERVFLSWPKAKGTRRKLQMANLQLLKKVKALCEREGLDYFLIGGTLLGAVRHQGFIPWDDDIDIGMLRDDFLRLQKLLKDDPLLRLDLYYNYAVGLNCAKIRLRGLEAFWVDIFVYDRVKVSAAEEQDRLRQIREASERLREEQIRVYRRYYPEGIQVPQPVRDERIDREIGPICEQYHAQVADYGQGNGIIETMDMNPEDLTHLMLEEEAFPLRKDGISFEGEKFTVFRKPEVYLRKAYGDYLQLPDLLEPIHTEEMGENPEEQLARLRELLGGEWTEEPDD